MRSCCSEIPRARNTKPNSIFVEDRALLFWLSPKPLSRQSKSSAEPPRLGLLAYGLLHSNSQPRRFLWKTRNTRLTQQIESRKVALGRCNSRDLEYRQMRRMGLIALFVG